MKIAKVYLKQRKQFLDQPYSYLVPDEAQIGQRGVFPFGKGDRSLEGIIVDFIEENPNNDLKEIKYLIDKIPLISKEQIELNNFLRSRNFGLYYRNLKNFSEPVKTYKNSKGKITSHEPSVDYLIKLKTMGKVRGSLQQSVLEALKESNQKFSELKKRLPKVTLKTLDRLKELGFLTYSQIEEREKKKTVKKETSKEFIKINVLSHFIEILTEFLYHSNGQTLIVFPNNFLAGWFSTYLNTLGIDSHYYNPGLKPNENFKFYNNVRTGVFKIIIATSQGLFLNFNNLETVIFTFTGDDNYFANKKNNYNAIEIAEKLSEIEKADLVFVDYIDSLISLEKIKQGEWNENKSISQDLSFDYQLEHIDIHDDESPIFSEKLQTEILTNLEKNQKTLLILNRRGYYNFYNCSKCHEPLKCPRCNSILRSIKSGAEVECRVCDFKGTFPDECSNCGNSEFNNFQFGIERVLEEVHKLAPKAKIAPYLKNLEGDIDNADIIVATSKILYVPKIKKIATVALVLPDIDLYFPDYQAPESAYRFYSDLLNRYDDAKVIIQTQNYNNTLLEALKDNSELFWDEQSEYRKLAQVPPYYDIYVFDMMVKGNKIMNKEVNDLQNLLKETEGVTTLKAHVKRGIKGFSQRRFIAKDKKNGKLRETLTRMINSGEFERFNSQISILVNPAGIL